MQLLAKEKVNTVFLPNYVAMEAFVAKQTSLLVCVDAQQVPATFQQDCSLLF